MPGSAAGTAASTRLAVREFFEEFFKNRRGQGDPKGGRPFTAPGQLARLRLRDRADGIVVTNNHVIADADEITAWCSTTAAKLKAELIGKDSKTDLAVLECEAGQAAQGGEVRQLDKDCGSASG
jgi:S1-C subfamily serine protease